MLAATIHLLEVILLALIGLLGHRLYALSSKNEQKKAVSDQVEHLIDQVVRRQKTSSAGLSDNYELKMDSLKSAQVFAGMQLIEVKREFSDLQKEQLDWLREAISLYLIGAIDFIGKQSKCGTKSRKQLINLVLKSNLHLSEDHAAAYFNEALHRAPCSDNDHMVRAGAKAAKLWLKQKTVPSDFSLRAQLNDWGVFA